MSDLINDGSLVGFWPLNEPSGAPTWKNFSPAYAGHPSGFTFDLQVHTADSSIIRNAGTASSWPSTKEFHHEASGVMIRGLELLGENDKNVAGNSGPFSKMLILGNGTKTQRTETLGPAVANSGFTAGIWVYPMSDGWLDAEGNGFTTASDSWFTGYARVHNLMGQFYALNNNERGWYMGISGSLNAATPVGASKFGGLPQLRAFLLSDVSAGVPPEIDTPIESGRYTHLTMSYRYVDGTNNELVLYKDGRVASSGITNREITFDGTNSTGPGASVLNLGGSTDRGTDTVNRFELTSGWGHMVSGAYVFRRVLNEGEILELHQRGGLQGDVELRNNVTEISLTDSDLIFYVEGKAPGWIDSSNNHYNLASVQDPGGLATVHYTFDPGPFKANRVFNDTSNDGRFVVAPSGASFDLATGDGGFTLCGFFQPSAESTSKRQSMTMSFGSVSTAVSGPSTPATVTNGATMGMVASNFFDTGFGQVTILEVFPLGNDEDKLTLRASGSNPFQFTNQHIGIVYDAGSKGLAFYLDGYLANSGTLKHNFQDQLLKLAGSGFPIMFMNGITNGIVDSVAKGVHTFGGENSSMGVVTAFSRPLEPDEMRFLAQSGINTEELNLTRNDPRLMGYWPCDSIDNSDIVIEDKARAMSPLLGHLSNGQNRPKWDIVYKLVNHTSSNQDIFRDDGTARIDLFDVRPEIPELASFGNLGITSGIFGPQGLSSFGGVFSDNSDSRNTPFNAVARWRPATSERDGSPQTLNEYVLSYEVTPSGDIPSLDSLQHISQVALFWFNSNLHVHGNIATGTSTTTGEVTSFLTVQNSISPDPLGFDAGTGPSGVTICFVSRAGTGETNLVPLLSGVLPFGVPSKVLFHAEFDDPYTIPGFLTGNSLVTISLWINGQKVNQRTDTANNWKLWSDQTVEGTNADWPLQFGGYAGTDISTTSVLVDGGLGDIYMREIFLMRGIFSEVEIESLANDGIQNNLLTGYNNQIPTTQVSIADSALEGYWRFNGFDGNIGQVSNSPGGSGTTDISLKGKHLDAIAQRFFEEGNGQDTAKNTRAIPGPLKNSDLAVQASGFHIASASPANNTEDLLPPFAVSGVGFDNPQDGFSVGFFMARRATTLSNTFSAILCYGQATTTVAGDPAAVDVDPNRGWMIGIDSANRVKMITSIGGNLYLNNVANGANSGQIVCGISDSNPVLGDGRKFNNYEEGAYEIPAIDYWDHYCWTYDPSIVGGSGIRCYLNGIKVDERFVPSDVINPWTGTTVAPQTPVEPTARMITFRSHQRAGVSPWTFQQINLFDPDAIITDMFYFSRALLEQEVRYVAFNGIDSATGTPTSGVVGGFIHGQDTGSGILGGFVPGQDTGSGTLGGFMPGGLLGSGSFGGYVSGVVFGDGTIGGFVQGLDTVSGIVAGYIHGVDIGSGMIAGYIQGQEVGSGHFGGLILGSEVGSGVFGGFITAADVGSGLIGGFILGGLQGNFEFDAGFTIEVLAAKDFDAQLEIAKTVSSDFDAKLIIFQDEISPTVEIVIPDNSVSGLAPPFNQYFIGKASGQQGKTITSTKWTFGDLSPSISVAESGAGCHPVQHMYATSGFYIAKFEAIDSDGLHSSDTLIINAASGIDPVIISLSGVPRSGDQALVVDFTTTIDILPPGVSLSTSLVNFDDGQTSSAFNTTHIYTQPGTYKPIWCVRDSRGIIWCDSLESGNDLLQSGGGA